MVQTVFTMNFENKHFNGTVSPAFANLTSLKNLVLSRNNLVGSIPDSLLSLAQLQLLDVSNNNLSGAIPKFPSTVKLITNGNVLIGTTPSTGGGGGTPSGSGSNGTIPSGSTALVSNGSSVLPAMIAGIVIAVIIFIVVVLFVSFKCYTSKKHRKFGRVDNPSNGTEIAKSDGGNVAISIQVLRQVTNNFSEDNILGRGGFGVVYKGELHDGTKIAVKWMESVAVGTKGLNEFQAEIAVLTKTENFTGLKSFAYLERLIDRRVEGREDMGVALNAGLLTADLRREKAGFEKDLQREAIGALGGEIAELGFWG
ncbi:hypothetical protein ACFX13_013721 [Malus domestica]